MRLYLYNSNNVSSYGKDKRKYYNYGHITFSMIEGRYSYE
jgi:hypothetical protein